MPAHFGSLTPDTLRFAAELRAGFDRFSRKPLSAVRLSLGRFPCVLLRFIADMYGQMIRHFPINVKRKNAGRLDPAPLCRGGQAGFLSADREGISVVASSSAWIRRIRPIHSAITARQSPDAKIVIDEPLPTPPPVTLPTASAMTPESP